MAKMENANEQDSEVDNRGATYLNQGHVYNAPVSHQTIVQENAVTYDVDKKDVQGLEQLSRFIIELLGERNVKIGAALTILLGAGSVSSAVWYAGVLARFSPYPVYVGFFLIFVSAVLWAALQYKYESRCVQCKTFYSMKELGDARVRQVNVRRGVRRTTIRTYRCSNCSHEVTKKTNEFIETEGPDG